MKIANISMPKTSDELLKPDADLQNNAILSPHISMNSLALAYSFACDAVIQKAIEHDVEQDFLIYPILFLFRQYLELRLKQIILLGNKLCKSNEKFPTNHDLNVLWSETKKVIKSEWSKSQNQEIAAVEKHIKKIMDIDKDSMAFRYGMDKKFQKLIKKGEIINLKNFGKTKETITNFLEGCSEGLSAHLEAKREMEAEYHQ